MSWNEKLEDTRNQLRALNRAIPETTKGFGVLQKAVKEEGVLEFKVKEFLALAIAIATHCESCIVLHISALIRIGATREEIADVLAMNIQMGGGPTMMYAAKALQCYDELANKE